MNDNPMPPEGAPNAENSASTEPVGEPTGEEAQSNAPPVPVHNAGLALADRFAGQLLRLALDALANQRVPWGITPQGLQQEVIDRLRHGFTEVIRHQMRAVAAAGVTHAEVTLQSIAAKGETVKIVVTVSDGKSLHDIVDSLGQRVVLVLDDPEAYIAGMESFEAQADQPPLPFDEEAAA